MFILRSFVKIRLQILTIWVRTLSLPPIVGSALLQRYLGPHTRVCVRNGISRQQGARMWQKDR